jgi:two-component system, NarL family, nitrate/nitrite response regulator NarL
MIGGTAIARIFIAGPYCLVRNGLKLLIEKHSDLTVVGEAANDVTTVERISRLRPDVLLLDIALLRLDGIAVLQRLCDLQVGVKTVLLTETVTPDCVRCAVSLAARGVVLKDDSADVLISAIHRVAQGEYWLNRETMSQILSAAKQRNDALTERELTIVGEITTGSSNAQIAERLHISEHTVKRHLANIYAKMNVSSRLELAMVAASQVHRTAAA